MNLVVMGTRHGDDRCIWDKTISKENQMPLWTTTGSRVPMATERETGAIPGQQQHNGCNPAKFSTLLVFFFLT